MSFNLAGESEQRPVAEWNWSRRWPLVIRQICEHQPDLIGFQEVRPGNWDLLIEHLTGYERLKGVPYGKPPLQANHASLFWRADRFQALSSGSFYLATDPTRIMKSWDASEPRCANWVKLRRREEASGSFLFINTHLEHRGVVARTEGARVLLEQLEKIREPGQPIILTGDFNCEAGSDPYEQCKAAGFLDTFNLAGRVDDAQAYSYHEFTGKRLDAAGRGRIDWILAHPAGGKWQCRSLTIDRGSDAPPYASDHFPVIADGVAWTA